VLGGVKLSVKDAQHTVRIMWLDFDFMKYRLGRCDVILLGARVLKISRVERHEKQGLELGRHHVAQTVWLNVDSNIQPPC
jgi:hypothetical protein